jgi:LuxR family transcriptional regulator, maltose regulon positive regulatory protein
MRLTDSHVLYLCKRHLTWSRVSYQHVMADVPGAGTVGAMVDTDVRERLVQSYRDSGPMFDLNMSKLRRPALRSGTVRRSALIDRLAQDNSHPVVSVVAPAGYGKTTLLAQWAERDGRAFAWVSVDEKDNDPKVLLTYVAEALDAIEPVGSRVFSALGSPASSVPGSVVPRLGTAFASMITPVVLVLDNVHLLRNSECRAALSVLADHVPAGSRLVLAGRDEPPLRVARLRAKGRILEIGPGDLTLTVQEAAWLLRAAEVAPGEADVAELHQRTEGWAAGLYLAALAIRAGGPLAGAGRSFSGGDLLVSESVESEFLARIPKEQWVFLTRTAVLEAMCGPLCEAVLELPGSAATLAGLARSNLLLVPLDRRGQCYRYHPLFRDMLRAELECREPDVSPVLRRRAAAWCVQNDLPEQALEYSMAAGDVDQAARLVESRFVPAYRQARVATVQRWLRWLEDRGGVEAHPLAAVWAALFAAVTGRPGDAERWADVVDRWQYQDAARPAHPAAEAWAAMVRAVLCRRGIEQMRADADEAARKLAAVGVVAPVAALLQGLARVLSGDLDGGDAFFQDAASIGQHVGASDVLADVLSERSLVTMARGDWGLAEALAGEAAAVSWQAGIEDTYSTPLVRAVQARAAIHQADIPAARQALISAQRMRPLLTYAIPHLAVQARIELSYAYLALADLAAARMLMREIDELLTRRPGLGTLAGQAEALRAQLSRQHGTATAGPSALTAAELRLLPLLSTHLTAAEIATELHLSPHTVRAQVKSTYRKLGATSRNRAVIRARELGLLDE